MTWRVALQQGAVTVQVVGDAWPVGPEGGVQGGPSQRDVRFADGARQGRPLPQLVAELLPSGVSVAVEVDLERRVLAVGAEVPLGVGPSGEGVGVAGRRLQLGGGPADAAAPARDVAVEVALVDCSVRVVAHQAADVVAAATDRASGVASGDRSPAGVPARQAADVVAVASDRAGGVAGDDGPAVVVAHQAADVVVPAGQRYRCGGVGGGDAAVVDAGQAADVSLAGDGAGGVAVGDGAVVVADQGADAIAICAPGPVPPYVGVHQPQVLDRAAAAHPAEQPHVGGGAVDEQVGDGVAVALEVAGEGEGRVANGRPARGGVVPRGRTARVDGGEVQAVHEFVAFAGRGAAHVDRVVGEGGGVDGRVGALRRRVAGVVHVADAVQVVAHGVQLGQGGYVDEVVVVGVVVRAQAGALHPAPAARHAADQGLHPVLVDDAGRGLGVVMAGSRAAVYLRIAPERDVSDGWPGTPVVTAHGVPVQFDPGLAAGGRQPQGLPKLVAELGPVIDRAVAVEVHLQSRVLAAGAEVPKDGAPVGGVGACGVRRRL